MRFESPNFEKAPDFEEGVDSQKEELEQEINKKKYGLLAKTARKIAFTTAMLLPAFAVGCGAVEKTEIREKPAAVESGFKDNAHENVKKRLEIKRKEISNMRKEIKATAFEKEAAKEAVEEMKKPMIDQDL